MLFKQETLEGIAEGKIKLAFRRWRRPTVKSGGSLKTPAGLLKIGQVEKIDDAAITASAAKRAGYRSRESLLQELSTRNGDLYRITFKLAGPDPRIALRRSRTELEDTIRRIAAMDARRRNEDSTRAFLELIAAHPGQRAAELASLLGRETQSFKRDVRRLKELGLTESLETGYRLSPRGKIILTRLRGKN